MTGRRAVLLVLALLAACGGSSPPGAGEPTSLPPTEATAVTEAPATPQSTVQERPTVAPTPTTTPDPEPFPAPEPSTTLEPASTPEPSAQSECVRVTDFANPAENLAWFVVNDNVMGGQSSGGPSFGERSMIFEGAINTNGGGFSSVRIQLVPGAFARYEGLQLRARTDGRPYKITLEDGLETRDRRVSHQAPVRFDTDIDDGWQLATVDFVDLQPRIFGRDVDSEPFRPDLADQLGIMLSDGVDGPFRIEIDWIDICQSPLAGR